MYRFDIFREHTVRGYNATRRFKELEVYIQVYISNNIIVLKKCFKSLIYIFFEIKIIYVVRHLQQNGTRSPGTR